MRMVIAEVILTFDLWQEDFTKHQQNVPQMLHGAGILTYMTG